MQKFVVHDSGTVSQLTGVTLGQVAEFVSMYPRVHIFVDLASSITGRVFEDTTKFEDEGMDAFFGDDPVWGGY